MQLTGCAMLMLFLTQLIFLPSYFALNPAEAVLIIERGKNNGEYSDSYIALWPGMRLSLSAFWRKELQQDKGSRIDNTKKRPPLVSRFRLSDRVPQRENIG